MAQVDKPNLVLPLACSYDQRQYWTDTFTNQRKVNSIYEPIVNSMTGNRTLRIHKRPGVTSAGALAANHSPFLAISMGSSTSTTAHWVITADTANPTNYRATNTSSANVIFSANNFAPTYVDKTLISGTETAVVQFRSSAGDGTTAQRVFYASAIGSWTEITDADFAATKPQGKMEHLDGYAFYLNSDNKIYNSDLNSLANWTATSFITKQIKQDRPMGMAKLGRMVLAFGAETVEAFYNAGNATGSPLARIPQLAANVGLASLAQDYDAAVDPRHYAAVVKNKLYFLGSVAQMRATNIGVYAFDGTRFEKVSTYEIDSLLNYTGLDVNIVSNVGPFSFAGREALAIGLSGNGDATQKWLMYFPEWNDWFEWDSQVIQPVNSGNFFLGNANSGLGYGDDVFTFETTTPVFQDAGVSYTMTHQFKLPQTGADRKRMHFAGVIGDTQTSASDLSISFSDDDYQTFSTARTIDLTKDKKQIYRCGTYRGRAVKLEHSANTDCRLEAFVARVE